MANFVYPSSILDSAQDLLALLGSLWSTTYAGQAVVASIAQARAQQDKQAHLDLLDLVASCSRLTVPVFHTDNWYLLTLRESQRDGGTYALPKFDGTALFGVDNGLKFGEPVAQEVHAWAVPEDLVKAPLILNRITSPSRTLVFGVDYLLQDGFLVFRDDPFDDPLIPKRTLLEGNVPVDRELGLWICRGQFDWKTVQQQFGYTLGFQATRSSEGYKQLVNAILDACVHGTSVNHVRLALGAAAGVPLVIEAVETVDRIVVSNDRRLVITDKNVYAFPLSAAAIVTPGQMLRRGDPLTDALTFYEFTRGACPDADTLPALVLGRGFLSAGFFMDLAFENKDVPLVVTTDADGYTRIDFEIDGWPGDVEKFFDDLHARGRAAGQTLANLLDQRPADARDTQPTAGALPTTLNPLAFLCANVLRNNAFLVKIRPSACIDGVGMAAAKILPKALPPQTAMIVVVELEHRGETITMDGPGTEAEAGYQESVKVYLGQNFSETFNGPDHITERLRLFQIGGRCV